MALARASWQAPSSLEQFYRELADDTGPGSVLSQAAKAMLTLLPHLHRQCLRFDVWGVTSHERLCLITDDDPDSPWKVIVEAVPGGDYEVRYRMPDDEAPWRGAMVWGVARSPEAAADLARIALSRSSGWTQA